MAKSTNFLMLLGVLALVMTGCLRETNEGDDSVALFPSPSPTVSQSVPSSEDIVSNPVVAQSVTGNQDAQSAPNNEISSFNGVSAPQDTVQQEVVVPTVALEQLPPQQSQLDAGATPTLDPLYARATQIILEPTFTAIAQTQTAQAFQQPLPSFTPVVQEPQQFIPTFTPAPTAFVSGTDCVHEVVQGENLFRMSLRYGVMVNDIARVSGITNINMILVGQKLTIPGCGTTGVRPPPTSFPTTASNNLAQVSSATTPVASAGGVTHIVQQGQTLFEISLQYGVPVNSIASRNGISNINLIYINQELIIP
ncbi:MAG: LysM peptidoglycan-binding domain-containing protein [Phototrophicales bacterium]|nr:LysM peptidoglycan-binding domain-containing protein [Phototrophicales bacterium]